jgi:hypothetical protein
MTCSLLGANDLRRKEQEVCHKRGIRFGLTPANVIDIGHANARAIVHRGRR